MTVMVLHIGERWSCSAMWTRRAPRLRAPSPLVGTFRGVIKLVFCLRRLPTLSRAEFQTYWRETHAPLVASVADTLEIRRYHQLHTVDDAINDPIRASRGGPASYDGVAELWWDSFESLAAPSQTEEGRAAGALLLEDERRFIDLTQSPLFLSQEHEVV